MTYKKQAMILEKQTSGSTPSAIRKSKNRSEKIRKGNDCGYCSQRDLEQSAENNTDIIIIIPYN